MNIKNEVLVRVYTVLALVVVAAVLIFAQAINIAVIQGDEWRKVGEKSYVQMRSFDAERGNILADDGSLLATALPFFDIRFDLMAAGLTQEIFDANVDSLAHCLAVHVDQQYTPGGMKSELVRLRQEGKRYHLIARNVSYIKKEQISQFPIFRRGQNGGGFIAERLATRKRPYGSLASRTIGYTKKGDNKRGVKDTKVGLEGYFDKTLSGKQGKRLMQKVHGDQWIPVSELSEIEPTTGNDILTTINVNIQDIAHEALLRGLNVHNAEDGVAIVMEVETGEVKAISNLSRTENGWVENYNNAIGRAIEPGSTFKLAPMIALLEDDLIDLNDKVEISLGEKEFYDEVMKDASKESFNLDSTTMRRAFEISSNVGIAGQIFKHYRGQDRHGNIKAHRFLNHLKKMNLHSPTGIEIKGEAKPRIKNPDKNEDDWSGTTLPWMAIGYELLLTPMQLLAFYNAVANDGIYMKPHLVTEVQQFGETIKKIKPKVVRERIASLKTIKKAQELLLSVVENGTAHKLATSRYQFAGKTGTAQVNYNKFKDQKKDLKHRASFVGYFPAKQPKYSCIVVVSAPNNNSIYGGDVAGPIFREISDKIYSLEIDLHQALNERGKPRMKTKYLPTLNIGYKSDMETVLNFLELPHASETSTEMTATFAIEDTIRLKPRTIKDEKSVPNVVGMGLRDALYVLENKGLRVEIDGVGKVKRQSIKPGTRTRGQTIKLTLS